MATAGLVSRRTEVPSAEQAIIAHEQAELLHDEIERLPGVPPAGRALLLRGAHARRGRPAAALPAGTIRSRLARRATSSGAASPAAASSCRPRALAAALAPRPASASVSSHLCETTTCAAIQFAAGQVRRVRGGGPCPGGAAIHDRSSKLRFTALALLLLGAVAAGAGYLTRARR